MLLNSYPILCESEYLVCSFEIVSYGQVFTLSHGYLFSSKFVNIGNYYVSMSKCTAHFVSRRSRVLDFRSIYYVVAAAGCFDKGLQLQLFRLHSFACLHRSINILFLRSLFKVPSDSQYGVKQPTIVLHTPPTARDSLKISGAYKRTHDNLTMVYRTA